MSDERGWFALFHFPGPALATDQDVFDHPGIADHFAFLRRRAAEGSLVAAGPLGDAAGEGLTVLRAESAEEAHRLAEVDDESVANGVLSVQVRRWQVRLAPALRE